MAWYNPVDGLKKLGDQFDPTNNPYKQVDPTGELAGQGQAAQDFAQHGELGFRRYGGELDAVSRQLLGQTQGQGLVSTEQLRQGLQQNLAAQQSMAASARPENQAMAGRTAMIQGGRMAAGMSGQAALAALQERDLAQRLLSQNQQAQLEANLRAALESRRTAGQAFGQVEDQRASRFNTISGQPTDLQRGGQVAAGAVRGIGSVASWFSDRRLKTDVLPADEDAKEFMDSLKAYRYRYKDQKHGQGEKLGIMAQDLEKSKMGRRAVRETGEGKAVDLADMASALAAGTANLNKRLALLEKKAA